jgi:hypothetical protein
VFKRVPKFAKSKLGYFLAWSHFLIVFWYFAGKPVVFLPPVVPPNGTAEFKQYYDTAQTLLAGRAFIIDHENPVINVLSYADLPALLIIPGGHPPPRWSASKWTNFSYQIARYLLISTSFYWYLIGVILERIAFRLKKKYSNDNAA